MNKPTKFEDLNRMCAIIIKDEEERNLYAEFCQKNDIKFYNVKNGCTRFNEVNGLCDVFNSNIKIFYDKEGCFIFSVKEIIDLHKDYVKRNQKPKLGWYIINPSTIVNIVHHITDVKAEYPYIGYNLAGRIDAYKEDMLNKAIFVETKPTWERVEIKDLDKIPVDSKVRLIGDGFISAKIKDLKELNICVANGRFVIVDQECEFASVEYLKIS